MYISLLFFKQGEISGTNSIYYGVCGSGMSRAVVFYSNLALTSYMGTYNFSSAFIGLLGI